MRRTTALVITLLISLMAFVAGVNLGATRAGSGVPAPIIQRGLPGGVNASLVGEVAKDLRSTFYKPELVTDEALSYGAATGMVDALGDPHSIFLPPEDNAAFQDTINGSLEGIGAELTITGDYPVVNGTIRGTPAYRAGLRVGDVILKIDGVDTRKMPLRSAVERIRGTRGTTVTLQILHRDGDQVEDVKIVREYIDVPSVRMEMKPNGIAVITLTFFRTGTGDELIRSAQELLSKGAKGVVLDLRDNPGGILDEAVKCAGVFLGDGKIVIQRGRTIERTFTIEHGQIVVTSTPGGDRQAIGSSQPLLKDIPLVVLMNASSASASEIVAGAIQDGDRGLLIGEQSYGKGTVQELLPLATPPSGASLKVTVAEWLTPAGRSINGDGLSPDVLVDAWEEDFEDGKDTQLEAAMNVLATELASS